MSHHRYPCAILDVPDQAVTPPWDDEIDVLVQVEQRGHLRPRLYRLDICARDGCP